MLGWIGVDRVCGQSVRVCKGAAGQRRLSSCFLTNVLLTSRSIITSALVPWWVEAGVSADYSFLIWAHRRLERVLLSLIMAACFPQAPQPKLKAIFVPQPVLGLHKVEAICLYLIYLGSYAMLLAHRSLLTPNVIIWSRFSFLIFPNSLSPDTAIKIKVNIKLEWRWRGETYEKLAN